MTARRGVKKETVIGGEAADNCPPPPPFFYVVVIPSIASEAQASGAEETKFLLATTIERSCQRRRVWVKKMVFVHTCFRKNKHAII
jgi:hypothetical protein